MTEVTLRSGDEEVIKTVEADPLPFFGDCLAIHRQWGGAQGWTVTHIPTGEAFCHAKDKSQVIGRALRMAVLIEEAGFAVGELAHKPELPDDLKARLKRIREGYE